MAMFLCCGFSAAWCQTSLAEALLVGRASVVDGDTIVIHGDRVRFNGIDAPESAQTCVTAKGREYRCGAVSAAALDEFLSQSTPASCQLIERDRYGRFVGTCFRADGVNVNEWMVANGYALDWPRYSKGAYSAVQEMARAARHGLWSGTFQEPWEWRKGKQAEPAPVFATSPTVGNDECLIKGNISSGGKRIYHSPGQRDYGKTKVDERKGERWFCSGEEAQSAGWRPAQR